MAGSETLELIVNLRGTAGQGLRQVNEEVKKTAAGFESLKSPVASFGKAIAGIGAALGAAFTASALISWAKEAVRTFAEFDDVMRQVKSISGATADEFERMTKLAKEMGQTTQFSAKDAATTMRILAQAGFTAAESMTALPSVMTLAAAGMTNLSNAAEIAGGAMNAYGLVAEDLPSVNNVLVRTVNATNASLEDLGTAFTYVAPIAKGFGADFEDLNAAIGQLHNALIKGSTAGTTLRGILSALFNPTEDEAELMQKLGDRIGGVGLQIRNAQGQFIGFLEIVKQMEKAGITGAEALRLFGDRAGPGMEALVNKGSASLSKLKDFLSETDDIADKTAKDFEAGLGGALRKLTAAFEGVKIAFGDAFGKDLQELITFVRDEVLKLIKVFEDLKNNGTLSGWAEDVKEALTSIGYLIDIAIITPISYAIRGLIELGNTARGVAAVVRGELSFKEFAMASAKDLSLILKDLSVSPEFSKLKIKLRDLEQEIANTQKNIAQAAALASTEMDQSFDVESEKEKLKQLQEEWKVLSTAITNYGRALSQVPTDLEVNEGHNPDPGTAIDSKIRNIGRAGAGAVKAPLAETKAQKAAREATVKTELAAFAAQQKEFQALMNETYQVGLIVFEKNVQERIALTNEFYAQQKQAAIDQATFETTKLQELANKERAGSAERIKLEGEIVVRKKELAAELIAIETKRYEDEYRLAQEAKQKKVQLEGIKKDIDIRTKANEIENPFEREQTEQKLRLDEKHRLEMESLKKLTDDEATIRDLARAQELEKQRLHENQVRDLRMMQLDAAKQVAGGVEALMTALYEGSGKKVKAFFYIAKAAAIAEATMNIAQGITKALGQGGYYGMIMGASVAAAGAAQLAKITSQQMASGGLVEGSSPTPRSDDKLIAATSGEFMHPVKAVKYYGVGFMKAIQSLQFPKDLAGAFSASYPLTSPSKRGFASGGSVGSGVGDVRSQAPEKAITINNILDPQLFAQFMASSPGQKQLLNVISNNAFAVKQVLFANG